jgi:hypothetical protein
MPFQIEHITSALHARLGIPCVKVTPDIEGLEPAVFHTFADLRAFIKDESLVTDSTDFQHLPPDWPAICEIIKRTAQTVQITELRFAAGIEDQQMVAYLMDLTTGQTAMRCDRFGIFFDKITNECTLGRISCKEAICVMDSLINLLDEEIYIPYKTEFLTGQCKKPSAEPNGLSVSLPTLVPKRRKEVADLLVELGVRMNQGLIPCNALRSFIWAYDRGISLQLPNCGREYLATWGVGAFPEDDISGDQATALEKRGGKEP